MKTFRDKHFKNRLDPKAAYYDCIRSCEINTSTELGVENCVIKCTRPLAASEGYWEFQIKELKRLQKVQ